MYKSAVLFLTLMALAVPSHAQFTFAPINVPGALQTQARGLNVNGEVAGFYQTVACSNYTWQVPNCPTKGFKYVSGTYTKLMVPGSVTTAIMGVNDYGDLVGFYSVYTSACPEPVYHGFVWYHTNVIKTIDAPGTATCTSEGQPTTVPFGINKAGTIVGGIWALTPDSGSFPSGGWVWVNGTFSTMDPENAPNAGPCCWSVNGIANNGFISGQLFQADFFMAWFKDSVDEDFYEYYTMPSTGGDTFGTGVNSNSDTVGYGSNGGGGFFAKHIELNEGSADAVEVTPRPFTVAYPGTANGGETTYPFSVNDVRGVAGMYVDTSGNSHGFIAKPDF